MLGGVKRSRAAKTEGTAEQLELRGGVSPLEWQVTDEQREGLEWALITFLINTCIFM